MVLESLKKVGRDVGRELNRAWENLAEGWRELLTRSGNALTHFVRGREEEKQEGAIAPAAFPSWGLLAGEVVETGKEIIVRLEVPGMEKENCEITIEGNTLYLRGEKRFQRETEEGRFHVMERAYGSFERVVPLPQNVDSEAAEASYHNGVLTVRLPKTEGVSGRRIAIK
jgi:HSP20 family protein